MPTESVAPRIPPPVAPGDRVLYCESRCRAVEAVVIRAHGSRLTLRDGRNVVASVPYAANGAPHSWRALHTTPRRAGKGTSAHMPAPNPPQPFTGDETALRALGDRAVREARANGAAHLIPPLPTTDPHDVAALIVQCSFHLTKAAGIAMRVELTRISRGEWVSRPVEVTP
jgi:hypothetical protein